MTKRSVVLLAIILPVLTTGVVLWQKDWFGLLRGAPIDEIETAPNIEVHASDWPWWRGPTRDGVARGDLPPTSWSTTENVLWKSKVPGSGHASPILCGDKIFIATADSDKQTMSLVCFDKNTGDQLWTQQIHQGKFTTKHQKNSHASATPACDGERVFTAFTIDEGLWLSALTTEDGDIVWQKKVGPFQARHGFGSSPVLYKSLVIVAGDHLGSSYIAALDRQTGDTVWRKQRQYADSYATPIVAEIAGRPQLLLSGQNRVTSYDPASGKQIWTCEGPAKVTANTMSVTRDRVIATGGYPQRGMLCIRADGDGDVTDSHLLWQNQQRLYVPSPVVTGDKLLAVQDRGIAQAFDLDTGQQVWTKRLPGQFSASPVLVADHAFVPNEQGTTYVIQTSPNFKVIAANDLNERCMATPAIANARLYLRTDHHLYCIGQEPNN